MGLEEHRSEVELIDERIIRLIGQRICLAKKIFEAKSAEGRPIKDPARERQVLGRVTGLAEELDLDAGAVREIFQILIRMSLQKQQELLGKKNG
jgi:chorismate mutase